MKWYKLYKWQDTLLWIAAVVIFFVLSSNLPNLQSSGYGNRMLSLLDSLFGAGIWGLILWAFSILINLIYRRIKK